VEPVLGFCSKDQYKNFIKQVNIYEDNFVSDKKTTLLKLYFSVSKKEQAKRFNRRKNDPLRKWKLSEVDLQAQELWDEFTEKKFRLLKKTHTEQNPWYIIRSDDKHKARLETMKLILNTTRYRGRNSKLSFEIDKKIVIPGEKELKRMMKHKRKHGRYKR